MNYELVPCQIVDCDEAGKYSVSGNTGNTIQVCAVHALEIAELHDRRKKGDDDGHGNGND